MTEDRIEQLARVAHDATEASYERQFGLARSTPDWTGLPEPARQGFRDVVTAVVAEFVATDPVRRYARDLLAAWDDEVDITADAVSLRYELVHEGEVKRCP